MITFATAGKPDSFKGKYPHDLPDYLAGFGLNGYEVQCGRGINLSDEVCGFFSSQGSLNVSLHAPYYISVSSVDEAIRTKSVDVILQSAQAADRLGAERVVVHSGSCAKLSRETALGYALETLKQARETLDANGLEHILLCPETMGKVNQLGTLDEVLELCAFDERMIPCVDFGHLNARNHGKLDCSEILDKLEQQRYGTFHCHFSKIEYTAGGEKKHLTFADTRYGPEFEPFIDGIAKRGLQPFIVCESDGTQAEDCAKMAEYYRRITNHD
jgi:deoxyribonuclease-4